MINLISSIPTVLTVLLLGCGATFTNNEKITGYNLTKPDNTFLLPDTLHEVSGLTDIDSTTFACIQDENGILFIYDAKNNVIKKQYTFNLDGDYEGITRVDQSIYVLRSDGTLFEISNYTSDNFKLTSYTTGIPANNNEGLCYDQENGKPVWRILNFKRKLFLKSRKTLKKDASWESKAHPVLSSMEI